MKLTRTPLALMALVAFTPVFAGKAEARRAPAATACQAASCAMDPAKAARRAPAPVASGSWYLPTWEETSAATNGAAVCDEVQSPAAPAAATPSAWYLPSWEETAVAAAKPMACCETPCPMAQVGQAQSAPAGKPAESWYLPS